MEIEGYVCIFFYLLYIMLCYVMFEFVVAMLQCCNDASSTMCIVVVSSYFIIYFIHLTGFSSSVFTFRSLTSSTFYFLPFPSTSESTSTTKTFSSTLDNIHVHSFHKTVDTMGNIPLSSILHRRIPRRIITLQSNDNRPRRSPTRRRTSPKQPRQHGIRKRPQRTTHPQQQIQIITGPQTTMSPLQRLQTRPRPPLQHLQTVHYQNGPPLPVG